MTVDDRDLLDADLEELARTLRAFVAAEVTPLARDADRSGTSPAELLVRIADLGYLDLEAAGLRGEFTVIEELARGWGALALCAATQLLAARLCRHGERGTTWSDWRAGLVNARLRPTLAVPAATDRVEPAPVVAAATAEGWLLSGCSVPGWVDQASGLLFLVARTEDESDLLVAVPLDGRAAPRSARQLESFLPLRVARYDLSGVGAGGWQRLPPAALDDLLDTGRLLGSALVLGTAAAAAAAALRYGRERHQFGRAIATFGEIQGMLVENDVAVSAARSLAWRAVADWDAGARSRVACARAWLAATSAALAVTERTQHVYGGYGHMMEFDAGRYTRDVRSGPLPTAQRALVERAVARWLGVDLAATPGGPR